LQEQEKTSPTQQYLAFQILPTNAVLEVEGELWEVASDGSAMKFVNFGTYNYRVQASNYHPEIGKITVNDPEKTQKVSVNLNPNFGWIEVTGKGCLQGANVYVDNSLIGKAPCKSEAIGSGQHTVHIAKEMYKTFSETVTVTDNQILSLSPNLEANFAEVTLSVDADAEIWVNNEKKGVRTWTGALESGTYKIECKQVGHETSMIIREITVDMEGQPIRLPQPKPIYGSLNIESIPGFATLYIDGNMIGETPKFISEILIGNHKLKLTKEGYADYLETITIIKGERKQVQVAMDKNNSSLKTIAISQDENTPVGAINGLFSVSGTKKVYFSKGNLQYQASTNIWRFAENQWDCIGNDNSNVSLSYKGWIDLFGCGTGDRPIAVSEKDNDYDSFVDWGSNSISNGGLDKDLWRTLSVEEWQYVFLHRYTRSGIRYAKAVVNGVKGMIVLPDAWISSFYPLNETNNKEALFESNEIDASSWGKLESVGVVFLPAAGSRSGISIYDLFSWGKYWTASRSNSNSSNYIYFGNRDLYLNEGSYLHYGRSVRLVQDYQP
ncbi:MAG: PEGA domain-containing protein, partial [Alphaproteobacteria bacterium]|nr:PEGA domain-containing protein [Alphaproteobacteria bacterium]